MNWTGIGHESDSPYFSRGISMPHQLPMQQNRIFNFSAITVTYMTIWRYCCDPIWPIIDLYGSMGYLLYIGQLISTEHAMIVIDITDELGGLVTSAAVPEPPFEMHFSIGNQTYKMKVFDCPEPEKKDLNGYSL
jgi:hypothetical protein